MPLRTQHLAIIRYLCGKIKQFGKVVFQNKYIWPGSPKRVNSHSEYGVIYMYQEGSWYKFQT